MNEGRHEGWLSKRVAEDLLLTETGEDMVGADLRPSAATGRHLDHVAQLVDVADRASQGDECVFGASAELSLIGAAEFSKKVACQRNDVAWSFHEVREAHHLAELGAQPFYDRLAVVSVLEDQLSRNHPDIGEIGGRPAAPIAHELRQVFLFDGGKGLEIAQDQITAVGQMDGAETA